MSTDTSSDAIDYKSIVLKQRERSLRYYHENKNEQMMKNRNDRQREFYQKEKEYYKVYNKYRRAKKLDKLDEFIQDNVDDYNMLITSGRVRALKDLKPVQVQVQDQDQEQS